MTFDEALDILCGDIIRKARAGEPVTPAEAAYVHCLLDPIVSQFIGRKSSAGMAEIAEFLEGQ